MEAATTVTRAAPKEHTLVHFEIPATDPSKVARFYEQLFGWKFNKWEGANMDYWLISHKDAQSADDTLGTLQTQHAAGRISQLLQRQVDRRLDQERDQPRSQRHHGQAGNSEHRILR